MKNFLKKNALLVSVMFLTLVASVSVATASAVKLHGWDLFHSEAGHAFGLELAQKTELPTLLAQDMPITAGAGGDTFTSAKRAYGIMSPDSTNSLSSTTPAVSLLNGSGVARILRGCDVYLEDTSGWSGEYHDLGSGSTVLDFSTSTTATASSTDPIWSIAYASSSLDVVSFTSSSLHSGVQGGNGKGYKRVWANGEYLNIEFSNSVSTTEGYAGCDFDLLN